MSLSGRAGRMSYLLDASALLNTVRKLGEKSLKILKEKLHPHATAKLKLRVKVDNYFNYQDKSSLKVVICCCSF